MSASARLRASLASRGLRGSLDHALTLASEVWFDWRWGTETRRHTRLDALQISSGNREQAIEYQPSRVRPLRALLRELRPDTRGGFVDYGCGKGRVLLLAAEAGFARITGVEFSPELAALARANVERYSARAGRAAAIQVRDGDAALFEPGADDTLFFFYFPFKAPVMAKVLARIEASLARAPRAAQVVYVMPASASADYRECAELVARSGSFRRTLSRCYWGTPIEVFAH